MVPAWLRGGGV
uniref:Uncharacterized protein n=1 Tax=Arundo donax TaxID=35708 RepID=A0A0A9FZI8_ARUDO